MNSKDIVIIIKERIEELRISSSGTKYETLEFWEGKIEELELLIEKLDF